MLEPQKVDLARLGFEVAAELSADDDTWMERLREAEAPFALGAIGPYEVLDEIHRGGQGVVFRARQPRTQRVIALKRLVAGSFASSSARLRFEREVEAAAALNHPGIVTVYGMETVDSLPVFAMEWIDGVPLTEWAWGRRSREAAVSEAPACPDPLAALETFARVCDAVQHAHARGVLHRDLKPSNILVDSSGGPHVLDFGLAKRFDVEGAADITRSEDFLGTPAYASPEQLRGNRELDARTDVFSLGVLLHEMLTGRAPFSEPVAGAGGQQGDPVAGHPVERLARIESARTMRVTTLDFRLGRELDTLVQKALAVERDERYPSVDALAQDVRRYLAGEPIQAVEPSSVYLLRKLVRRNPLAASFVATVVFLLGAFAVYASRQASLLAVQVSAEREARGAALAAEHEARRNAEMALEAAARYEALLFERTDAPSGFTFSSTPRSTPAQGEAGAASAGSCAPVCGTPNPYFEPMRMSGPAKPRGPVDPLRFEGP